MINVAVIDDHPLVFDGVRRWCETADPPIAVAATFGTPDAFLAATPPLVVDAVILDLQFDSKGPDREAVRQICADGHRVVVLSAHTDPDLVLDCLLNDGVVTYLSKAEGREHLIAAVHAAISDLPYLSLTMGKAVELGRSPDKPRLSPKEHEVLLAWFQAESKALVARELFITTKTIDTYLARIRAKYAAVGRPAPTKAALVARAIKDGLITPDDL